MANNPKKVKDPTEVALSAIQEALNISEAGAEANRSSIDGEIAPPTIPAATPAFSDIAVRHPREHRSAGLRTDR